MTRTRGLLLLWAVVGIVVWNVYFDLWMSGAPREYLLRSAYWELGRGPEPGMAGLMREAARAGAVRATALAGVVMAAGLLTLRLRK